jgi:hypothetical protein
MKKGEPMPKWFIILSILSIIFMFYILNKEDEIHNQQTEQSTHHHTSQ